MPGFPILQHLPELGLCVYQLLFIISPFIPDYACVCVCVCVCVYTYFPTLNTSFREFFFRKVLF